MAKRKKKKAPGIYYQGALIEVISEQPSRYIARVNGHVMFIKKRDTEIVE